MEPFSAASRFPPRRRVTQACVACRTRKTRCDAAQPRCSFCAMHNIDCVYRDSQQPRIDYNTQVLLERIQLLEDRLLTTPTPTPGPPAPAVVDTGSNRVEQGEGDRAQQQNQEQRETTPRQPGQIHQQPVMDLDLQIPRSHTANANHVYSWPIVRQLLSLSDTAMAEAPRVDVTDLFFEPSKAHITLPPSSWRLYDNPSAADTSSEAAAYHRQLLSAYFARVNVFFPLLSATEVTRIHEAVLVQDGQHDKGVGNEAVPTAHYALLLLVLCLGSLVDGGGNMISLHQMGARREVDPEQESMWCKAKLLLGHVSSEISLVAAQCTMLACLYCGATGKISESFFWAHMSAVRCEALARVYTGKSQGETASANVPDEFSRLFWTVFIVEGDFVSEVSVTLPSGLSRYEELIPYPTFVHSPSDDEPDSTVAQQEEVMAFQITTNASIRRFLNRVNSAVYNAKEQQRRQQQPDRGADHATWLLHVAQDLWSHHAAVYRNLPSFLLTSNAVASRGEASASPLSFSSGSPAAHIAGLIPRGNDPWNIVRLQGRYYAGQYIIHRPFVEHALLNAPTFDTHPNRTSVLAGCKTCFEGCAGFIRVFDVDPANSITCLFATGMATFTMTIILMIGTVSPLFRDVQIDNVEEYIRTGIRNIERFSRSVREFEWHLSALEQLDSARGIS